ncbi:MAG: hypothetical protein IT223_05960 [Crocinitomicaceae bacterium]|nr:hypothetical protein [Crocinitomicaceae bacterium]
MREKKIRVGNDTLVIDTLSLVPGSFILFSDGVKLDSTFYTLDFIHARIVFSDTTLADSVVANYRVFPVFLGAEHRHKSIGMIRKEGNDTFTPYVVGTAPPEADIFSDEGLQKSGNISRGISFGNSQNLSVNSAMNLQMSGKITDRYSLLASVSDDNIPVQPDGNTQQLQDFDQIYIQLSDDRNKMIAGDFILHRPPGYFLNYFKRAQGAYTQIHTTQDVRENEWRVEASASVSKGRFSRNVIQGLEGNQGPYRLYGADAEPFIIALAGTEAVYIDGRLLERGQDKDYTIDYNAAEIVFTPRQFITKDRRIVVEFQYSEKRYARPLLHTSIIREGKSNASIEKIFLNIYSENDAKNQPLQQDLTVEEKAVLAAAGDNLLNAVIPGAEKVNFSNNQVLYAMVDSLGFDSVYVYSADSATAHYRVSFTLVGQGRGDYIEDGFTACGRKFKWMAPEINGNDTVPQGSYAPVVLLVAPKKKQMIVAGMTLIPGKKRGNSSGIISVEGAMSNNDLNTFSSVDSKDDRGFAFKASYVWKNRNTQKSADTTEIFTGAERKVVWNTALNYEYTGQHFSAIERFREVEFERNWNIQGMSLANDQHIAGVLAGIGIKKWGNLSTGTDFFSLGNEFSGYKLKSSAEINRETFRAVTQASMLNTEGIRNSRFIRHKSDISKQWGKIRAGFKDEHELNEFRMGRSDSLSVASYQFYDWQLNVGTADTTKTQISFFYRDRFDRRTDSVSLVPVARADQYGSIMSVRGNRGNFFRLNISNRRLRITDPERYSEQPKNTLLARVEYNFSMKGNFIQGNTFYETGSGLEQKREFIYLEVPAGQGSYIWIDYNGNGTKELNEFEIAQFAYEANYIRSFVQTSQYIKTFTNQFSQAITINPSAILKTNDNGWKKIVSKFSDQASYKVDRKTNREDKNDRFNPFLTSIADSNLIALSGSLRNVFFFNKTNPFFGMDYTFQRVQNKNLLSEGFESRSDEFNQIGLRWNFATAFTFYSETKKGMKRVASDFLSGRNYLIGYWQAKPKITWQPATIARFSLSGEYGNKSNRLQETEERATILKAGAEFVVNSPDKGTFQMGLDLYEIAYNGNLNGSLAFDMLEGLSVGRNYVWTASLQRTVAKNLQMNLLYNGRKPENIRTIHSGSVQVRAFF